jgi:hypothetical protein
MVASNERAKILATVLAVTLFLAWALWIGPLLAALGVPPLINLGVLVITVCSLLLDGFAPQWR